MTRFTVVVGCTLLWCATGLAQHREERERANQERPKRKAAPQKAQQNQRRNERARAVEPSRRTSSPEPFDWEAEYQKFLKENPGVKKAVEAGKIAKQKVIAEIKDRAAEKARQAELEENRSLEAEFQQLLKDRPEVKQRLESGDISKDQIMQRLRIGRQRRRDPAAAAGRAAGGRRGGRGWSRLKENDSDGDGKISKDEAPENIKRLFDRMDKNKDGFIEESEVGGRRGGGVGAPQLALRTKLGELIAAGKLTRAEAGELYQIAFPRNARPVRGERDARPTERRRGEADRDRAPAERNRERPQRGRRRGDPEPDRDQRERKRDRDNDGDRERDDWRN